MFKNIKLIALIVAMLCSANASSNEIYVEQVGSSSTINLTQQGSDNKIGNSINPAFIGSGSNTVNVEQIGSSNILQVLVNGVSTNLTVSTTGGGNTQEVICGSAMGSTCAGSTITQIIAGDDNSIMQNLGQGANHISNINVVGSTNAVTHTSTSTAVTTADITVTGNSNTIGVTQSGSLPQSVAVSSTGNSNTIAIVQSN